MMCVRKCMPSFILRKYGIVYTDNTTLVYCKKKIFIRTMGKLQNEHRTTRKFIDRLLLMKWILREVAMEYFNIYSNTCQKTSIMLTAPPAEIRIVNLQNTKLSHMLENTCPNSGANNRNLSSFNQVKSQNSYFDTIFSRILLCICKI